MKKFKIIMCMTSILMLAVMVVSIIGVMPKTTAYADDTEELPDYDFRQNNLSNEEYFHLFKWDSSCAGADSVSFWNNEADTFCNARISTSPIRAKYTDYVYVGKYGGGSSLDRTNELTSHSGTFEARGVEYYYVWYEMTSTHGSYGYQAKKGICFGTKEKLYQKSETYIRDYILGKLPTTFTIIGDDGVDTDKIPDGSSTNPIRDKSVGYPDIYEYNFLFSSPSSGGEWDKLKSADYFKWKSKSTTGFKLINHDSKYKDVYIQAKVVSKMQYNDSFFGKGEWHNFDNYGEEGYFGLLDPSDKELSVDYQKLTETLPKSFMETHNFKSQYFDFDYYFRIVYTRADDLKVIPTYYSGGWRRISCHSNGKHDENGEGENSSAIITDGDDDGDGWKTDDDSKDNDKNIDNGPSGGSDLDDAKDNANNKKNDSSFSGSLDIDSIKAFMSEVGNVPKAIGKLFSFLPTWVTTFIGFGFVVLVALIIIKAIRG